MDKLIGVAIVIAILVFIVYVIAYVIMGIVFIVFVIPTYIILFLYVVLEFISTNILIALDKIFYPGFNVSPLVIWAFWGLVIGAVIQGYREMRIYGRKQKGVLIALAPVALLAILKLISPPMSGSIEVHSAISPVAARRPPSPPPSVPQDDHGNTRSSATSLASLGSAWSGRIEPGSDIDYFKVQVNKSGVLTVYTTGNLDTRGILQNSSGSTLVRNLDDGSGNNFKIEQSVRAGTYYIKVESYRSYTGNYVIHVYFREQPSNRLAGSSSVRTPVSRQRSSSSPSSVRKNNSPVQKNDQGNNRSGATSLALGGSRSGQISSGSDIDYFKVQVSKSGVLTVYTTGSLDTRGTLQNSSGTSLENDDDAGSGNNFKIERSVSAGTYYIEIDSHNTSTGSYTVYARFRELVPEGIVKSSSVRPPVSRQRSSSSSVRNDDHSNTRSGATSLALGNSRSGHIKPGSDVDYFKVQVSQSGMLTVYTTGNLDTKGTLENSSETSLENDDDDGISYNFKIERSIRAGTYYIKVYSHNNSVGSYTIHAGFREQSPQRVAGSSSGRTPGSRPGSSSVRNYDHSNTRSGATSLALGRSRTGHINPSRDIDYFEFHVLRSGVLTVYTTGNLDTRGTLENSTGIPLASDDDDGSGNNFKIEHRVRAGTYYIKVEGHFRSSTGSYTIHTNFR